MYYGYTPTGTTGYLMGHSNPNQRIAGQNLAYAHATSDRGLMNREQNRKGYDSETQRQDLAGKRGLLSGLIGKVQF